MTSLSHLSPPQVFTLPAAVLPGTGTWALPDSDLPSAPTCPCLPVRAGPLPPGRAPPWAPPLLGVERCTCSQGAEGRLRVRPARAGNRTKGKGAVAGLRPARPQSAPAGSGTLGAEGSVATVCQARAPRQPQRGVRTEGFSLPTVSSPSPLALPNKRLLSAVDSESGESFSCKLPVVSEAFAALRDVELGRRRERKAQSGAPKQRDPCLQATGHASHTLAQGGAALGCFLASLPARSLS